ncbi:MAG: hypothetical protein HYU86_11965 [Chloroflexi bacterium]|nr:hypothetical protein [Chloroflexota bacterium]
MPRPATPHRLGVSPDGKRIYLPAADPGAAADDQGRMAEARGTLEDS